MANKQINELTASVISSPNDNLLFQNTENQTRKLSWGNIAGRIINNHILAGNNITLTPGGDIRGPYITISATDTTYTAGSGINISSGEIAVKLGEGLTLNAQTGNIDVTGGGGSSYTAGDGISIASGAISVKLGNNLSINPTTGNIDASGDGTAATIEVGTVTTGEPGTNAAVTNSGTTSAAVFNFTIPRGADGTNGTNGVTPHIDSTTKHWFIGETDTNIVAEGQDGVTPTIDNTTKHWLINGVDTGVVAEGQDGTNGNDGTAATIAVGTVTTGAAGTNASVTNSGTSSAAVLDFVIPRGADGSGGGSYSETELYSGTTRQTTMTLSQSMQNFDALMFIFSWTYNVYSYELASAVPVSSLNRGKEILAGTSVRYQFVMKDSDTTIALPTESGTWDNTVIITKIIGIKYN